MSLLAEITCDVPVIVEPLAFRDGADRKSRYRPADKLRLRCLHGQRLVGRGSLTCGEDGVWLGDMPVCQQVDCGPAPLVAHAYVRTQRRTSYPAGSDVVYMCNPGFTLDGPDTVHCQEQGTWEAFRPQCQQVTCVPPPDIPHGEVMTSLHGSGDVPEIIGDKLSTNDKAYIVGFMVSYVCSRGFEIHGDPSLMCTEDGSWNASTPSCEKVFCPTPEAPANGSVVAISERFRDIASYSCHSGFTLRGAPKRICMASKKWSGQTPSCNPISCGEPESIDHGQFTGSSFTYGQSITYTCDTGYVLTGLSERVCGVDGDWINPLPSCLPMECPSPPEVLHGRVIGTSHTLHATIEYTCDAGYKLAGNSSRVCLQDGTWSATSPFCEQIKCMEPKTLDNGVVGVPGSEFSPGTVVKYKCKIGYNLEGKSTRTCRSDGTWTGPMPKCKPILCKRPNEINYGIVSYKDMKYGAMAEYSCLDGYQLDGPTARMCSGDKRWTGDEPSCQAIKCPKPESISHGQLEAESLAMGAVVTYKCDLGFRIVGPSSRTCLQNQTWSLEAPWCRAVECVKPSRVISNGRMVSTNYTFSNTIHYVCDSGYEIQGSSMRTCWWDGTWNSSIPVCERVSCPKPLAPPNSIVEGFEFRYKEVVTYRCNPGYELLGNGQRHCTAEKTWSSQIPNCVRIECPPPVPIENGQTHTEGRYYRNKVHYSCDQGYRLSGNETFTCQSDKTWSGPTPRCLQVKCDVPPSIQNGIVLNDRNNVLYGDVIQYRCDPGYVLSNASMLTCTAQGSYTGQIPLCLTIKCTPPEQVDNADVVGSTEGNSRRRRGYGDMIEYVCRNGYDLHGDKYRRCNIHGKWSGHAPVCQPVVCPAPNDIVGGSANSTGELHFGERIVYSCNEGYQLVGNRVRICAASRTWTGTDPECVRLQCVYPDIEQGFVDLGPGLINDYSGYQFYDDSTPKYDYGEEITIVCDLGYEIEGKSNIKCLGNSKWKPGLPACVRIKCNPPSITNGILTPNDRVAFGTEVKASCLEGYRLVGNQVTSCPASGAWGDLLPECILVTCHAPPFSNGNMTVVRSPNRGSGYPYGMTIKFTCQVGYIMTGVNTITCQENGQWSHIVPRCTEILCDRPTIPSDAHAVVLTYGHNFNRNENISVGCVQGYESNTPAIWQCDLTGRWVGRLPTCTISSCSALNFENGQIFGRGGREIHEIRLGGVATFRCEKGFSLVGRRELVCLKNKTWSGDLPKCERVKCHDVDVDNGRVISARGASKFFLYGMKALFTCRDGYHLDGSGELECGPDGRWSGMPPTCAKVHCRVPSVENGHAEPYSSDGHYLYGDEVTLYCHEGYQLSDSGSSLVCRSDGTWSNSAPKCLMRSCATPVIINGKVTTIHPDNRQTKGTNVFGQTIRFECSVGFKLRGFDFAVCQGNGTWSRDLPKCEIILCPQLVIQNGRVANLLSASLALGSRVKIQCLVGFEVHGSRELLCVGDGEWQGAIPKCFPKECPKPRIPHGKIIGSTKSQNGSQGFTYGDSIRIVCDSGYDLSGKAEMVCQSDRTWSVTYPPRCDQIMCPPFPKVKNSEITVMVDKQGSNDITRYMKYGTSVQVGCMAGYQLDEGDSRLTCGSNKVWMGKVPSCKALSCPTVTVRNARVISRSSGGDDLFVLGNEVNIICNEGYQLSTNTDKLTCLENGTWSDSLPTCNRRRCSDISLQNGRVIGESFLFGDTVEFKCNEGYALMGPNSCRCQPNGGWDCMPLCFRISCPPPEIIPQGNYVATGFFYGDRLRYQCETGYELRGEADHLCQADMTWSSDTPSCHRTSCPTPVSPTNGQVTGTAYSFGDRVEYVCDEGFQMVGNQHSECMADRTWGPAPECVRISCGNPPAISHGKSVGQSNHAGTIVRYVCNEGYSSRGNIQLYCQETGTWHGNPPECVPITCPVPVRTANGFVLGAKRSYKSEVEHHCTRGFRMRGEMKQMCTANGTWSGRPPRCEVISCGGPSPLTNGHIDISAYFFGSVITYNCDYGYRLNGVKSRICQENGVWSDDDPKCEAITCPVPPRISFGTYMGTDTKMNSHVFYNCAPQYRLVGLHQRVCQSNGTWSGDDPACVLKECHRPSPPDHGQLSAGDGSLIAGSTVTFSCDPGYKVTGTPTLTCRDGDQWSHDFPSCAKISCGPPREIEHGHYREISFYFQDVVTYQCDTGYSRQGNPQVTCQSTGLWSAIEVRCVVGNCGPAPYVSFATASVPFRCDTGRCVSYVCDEGYEQNGPYVVHCGADGRWMYPLPKCEAKSCGLPPVIHHSSTTITELESGGLMVHYDCNTGYTLVGSPKVYCMTNGTWMFERKPSCEPADCGPPPEVANSLVLSSDHTIGHFARYRCDPGFKLVGHPVIQCRLDGTWNDTGPVCVGRTCPHPEVINNGYINGSDFSLGSSIEYVCMKGYLPAGETNRTCRDGRWSGMPPSCQGETWIFSFYSSENIMIYH